MNTKSVVLPAQIRTVVKLVPLTAECQMYEEWKSLMLYVYTLFHKTGQLESASSSIRGKISQLTSRPWPAE